MAHERLRRISQLFRKKSKLWPVICLYGPRQCGKTTFLRHQAWPRDQFSYVSLDLAANRRLAKKTPEIFLASFGQRPLVIDEAHKAPELFDEAKGIVDEKRTPGRYVLSGSVKFSKKVGIREALTGRAGTLRMDTLSLSETLARDIDQDFTLAETHQYLEKGGMPGACFLRSAEERHAYWEEWLETTCELDLKIFANGRLSGDLARETLEHLARSESVEAGDIARKIGIDTRRVQNHLDALEQLFVVRAVQPSADSEVGKPRYYLLDAGLAHHLGAETHRRWQCWFLSEHSVHSTLAEAKSRVTYFRSRGGIVTDFRIDDRIHLFSDQSAPGSRLLKRAKAVAARFPRSAIVIHVPSDERIANHKLPPGLHLSGWSKLCRTF